MLPQPVHLCLDAMPCYAYAIRKHLIANADTDANADAKTPRTSPNSLRPFTLHPHPDVTHAVMIFFCLSSWIC